MANIFVTLRFGNEQSADLALPEDVPAQFLAEALAGILKLPVVHDALYTLTWVGETSEKQIPHASTLSTSRVLNGSYMRLEAETIRETNAFLVSTSGVRFPLKPSLVIGRRDKIGKTVLDIDLESLDPARISSHMHAYVVLQDGFYCVIDKMSRNGTWLNDQRLQPGVPARMKDGDAVHLGPPGKGVVLHFQQKTE